MSDLEALDALRDPIGDDDEAEAEFIDWLTGGVEGRAGALPSDDRAGGLW